MFKSEAAILPFLVYLRVVFTLHHLEEPKSIGPAPQFLYMYIEILQAESYLHYGCCDHLIDNLKQQCQCQAWEHEFDSRFHVRKKDSSVATHTCMWYAGREEMGGEWVWRVIEEKHPMSTLAASVCVCTWQAHTHTDTHTGINTFSCLKKCTVH